MIRISLLASISLVLLLVFGARIAPALAADDLVGDGQQSRRRQGQGPPRRRPGAGPRRRQRPRGDTSLRGIAAQAGPGGPSGPARRVGRAGRCGGAACGARSAGQLAGQRPRGGNPGTGRVGRQGRRAAIDQTAGQRRQRENAVAAVTALHGEGVNAALCAAMKTALPAQHVKLLQVLVARHAVDSVPALLDAAKDADARVRGRGARGRGPIGRPGTDRPAGPHGPRCQGCGHPREGREGPDAHRPTASQGRCRQAGPSALGRDVAA